ncbi:hypothetical protein MD484_g5176, partial [Candolleomyces efflorescens]
MSRDLGISKLPLELLTEIFLTLEASLFNYGETYPRSWERRCHILPPLGVTHVCSSWRNILLKYPPYWTKIVVGGIFQPDSQHWVSELVHRSRGLPLDIKVISHPHSFGYNIDCIMEHIAQIRSLELADAGFLALTEYRKGSILLQAPLLEQVVLRNYAFEDNYHNFHLGMPRSFVEDPLWRIEAPKITRYSSGPGFSPYVVTKFTAITKLEVFGSGENEALLPSNIFFRALSELHHLENLAWITPLESSHPFNGPTVHLSHLRSVTLGIDPRPLLDFLRWVEFGASCTVDLKIDTSWIDRPPHSDVDELARAISDQEKKMKVYKDQKTTVNLKFSRKDPFVFELIHSQRQLEGVVIAPPASPNIRLSVEREKGDLLSRVLTLFCSSLHIVLNEANISDVKVAWMENLEDVFARFSLTCIFAAWRPDRRVVMEAVTELTVHNVHWMFFDDLGFTGLCPSLQTLRITGAGTMDSREADMQKISIRALRGLGGNLQVVDIRGLDPKSALYTSLVNAVECATFEPTLLT